MRRQITFREAMDYVVYCLQREGINPYKVNITALAKQVMAKHNRPALWFWA